MVMSEAQSVSGTDLGEILGMTMEGQQGKECGWPLGPECGSRVSHSKEMGTSALQPQGNEFCQNHDEPGGRAFSSSSRRELGPNETLISCAQGAEVSLISLLASRAVS